MTPRLKRVIGKLQMRQFDKLTASDFRDMNIIRRISTRFHNEGEWNQLLYFITLTETLSHEIGRAGQKLLQKLNKLNKVKH